MPDCHCTNCQLAIIQKLLATKVIPLLELNGGTLMSLNEDLAAIKDQLGKAKDEIVAKVAELEAQVAAGQVDPQTVADLKAAAQALDDVVVDEPPVEPTP